MAGAIVPLQNMEKCLFSDSAGYYNIPYINGVKEPYDESTVWIPFNYVKSYKGNKSKTGVHFHVHDYQFERLWSAPDTYMDMLKDFRYVCSPEFSVYTNMPRAMQIWNHYRKHWVGAYMEIHGIRVIPTITWGLPQTYKFIFDGEPENSLVMISSVGMGQNKEYWDNYYMGYEETKARLHPLAILANGKVPDDIHDVIPIKRGYKLFGRG